MNREKISQTKKSAMPKKFYQGFLTTPMKKYITSTDKSGYNKSEYDKRLIGYAKLSLKNDLPFLAEKLDEELQSQIFNQENLMPFFKALFDVNYGQSLLKEEKEKRRQRLLRLAYELLVWIGVNGAVIAPNAAEMLKKQIPLGVNSIFLEAYWSPQ